MLSALSAPESWNQADVLRLHRMIGNRAVGSLIGSGRTMNPTGTGIHQDPSRLNTTGLPDRLKAGIETLSGMSLDEVRVHRNTARPAQLDALAYTKGVEIYVGPGQEHHLPHEAWHVVQQAQGRVKQTLHAKGVGINDEEGLEREADVMGTRALQMQSEQNATGPAVQAAVPRHAAYQSTRPSDPVIQRKCRICGAKSHSEAKCPKRENKAEDEPKRGRGLTSAGKKEMQLLEHLLNHDNWDPTMMYGSGGKSIIGGYNGKKNGLDDITVRIDRQSRGNVQFQVGDNSYACAVFEQTDEPDEVIAALRRSIRSGRNETVG